MGEELEKNAGSVRGSALQALAAKTLDFLRSLNENFCESDDVDGVDASLEEMAAVMLDLHVKRFAVEMERGFARFQRVAAVSFLDAEGGFDVWVDVVDELEAANGECCSGQCHSVDANTAAAGSDDELACLYYEGVGFALKRNARNVWNQMTQMNGLSEAWVIERAQAIDTLRAMGELELASGLERGNLLRVMGGHAGPAGAKPRL